MNFVQYMNLYSKIKQLKSISPGRYSFGPSSISYTYTIPVAGQRVHAAKTMTDSNDKQMIFSYTLTVTETNGRAMHTVYGTWAERIFKILLNREHTK